VVEAAQWAIDAMFDAAEKRRKVAYRVIGVLGRSKLAGSEELQILDSLVADELGNEGDTDGVEESDTGDR
jgi:hypothetical protein